MTDVGASTAPTHPPRRRLSLGRKLAFSAFSLGLFLALCEASARALGVGDLAALNGSPIEMQWIYPPLLRATADGSGYRPTDGRMVDRFLPRGKPGELLRVFVFGESAVAGVGFSENGSFPRALERRLEAAGARNVRVVNCGIEAISSRQVHLVEREVLKTLRSKNDLPTRDLFVFYVGNNEFFHLNAERYRERMHGKLPFSVRLDRALGMLHVYAGLKGVSRTLRAHLTPSLRLGAWTGSLETPEPLLSPEDVREGTQTHATQLRAMVEDARAAGAIPVLMTVVTNQEWAGREEPASGWIADSCGGVVPSDPDELRARLEAVERGATAEVANPKATSFGRWRSLVRRAHVRRALGRLEEARADLVASYGPDDPYHLRCLPEMNEGVRSLAAELDVPLVDAAASVARISSDGITGYSFVFDNVHMTVAGNERVAEALHRVLAKASFVPPLEDSEGYVLRRVAAVEGASRDSFSVRDWLGWNDDRAYFTRREGERFKLVKAALEDKIRAGHASPAELVWAANGHALFVGGEARARELYRGAREKDPSLADVVAENLRWLDARPN